MINNKLNAIRAVGVNERPIGLEWFVQLASKGFSIMNKTGRTTGKILAAAATASVLWTLVTPASAAPVVPSFTDFGDLPQATFGGSGIPTDPTAITTFNGIGGDIVTLGLAATPRFANPPLTNDGAGTYTALAGANDGTPGSTVWRIAGYLELQLFSFDNGHWQFDIQRLRPSTAL